MRWKIVALVLIAVALTPATIICARYLSGPRSDVTGTGTITYLNFEGGFWGIVGDDGERYDPINLDPEFKVEGLRVYFEADYSDRVSFNMWGRRVIIRNIQKLTN